MSESIDKEHIWRRPLELTIDSEPHDCMLFGWVMAILLLWDHNLYLALRHLLVAEPFCQKACQSPSTVADIALLTSRPAAPSACRAR